QSCATITNTASAAATNEGSTLGNNSGQDSVTVNCASIEITKVADASPVNATDPIGFVITVSNNGSGVARTLSVDDLLPTCADLARTTVADASPGSAGDPIGFVVTVANNGTGAAYGLTADDALPTTPGLSWSIDAQNSDPGWSINGSGHLVYGPAILAAGAS